MVPRNLILATPGNGRKISQTILHHALHKSQKCETHLVAVCRDQNSLDSFQHICDLERENIPFNLHVHPILAAQKAEQVSFFSKFEKEFIQLKPTNIQFILAGGCQEVLLDSYVQTHNLETLENIKIELVLGDDLDYNYFPDGFTHERWFKLHQDFVKENLERGCYSLNMGDSNGQSFDLYRLPSSKANRVAFAVFLEMNEAGPSEWFKFALSLDEHRQLNTSMRLDVHMPTKKKTNDGIKGISQNNHNIRERKWLRYGIPFIFLKTHEVQTLTHLHRFSKPSDNHQWTHESSSHNPLVLPPVESPTIPNNDLNYISHEDIRTNIYQNQKKSQIILIRLETRREVRSLYKAMSYAIYLQQSEKTAIQLNILIDLDFKIPRGFYDFMLEHAPNTAYIVEMPKDYFNNVEIFWDLEGFQGKDILPILDKIVLNKQLFITFYPNQREWIIIHEIFHTAIYAKYLLHIFFLCFNHHFTDWESASKVFFGDNDVGKAGEQKIRFNEKETVFKLLKNDQKGIDFSINESSYRWESDKIFLDFGPQFCELLLSLLGHLDSTKDIATFTPLMLSFDGENISFKGENNSLYLTEEQNLGQKTSNGRTPDMFGCKRDPDSNNKFHIFDAKGQFSYKETQKYSKFFRSDKGNLSKYRIGLQGFPVEVTCVQFFGPSVNDNSPPNLDIFLQCRDSGFILKVFDLSAPRWIQGVTLKQMKDFLFEEVREPEKEEWRFEVWLKSNS